MQGSGGGEGEPNDPEMGYWQSERIIVPMAGSPMPPVERVWLEKEGGKKRPIGKPCFEDKSVQRAVVMILEAIFDQDVQECSHGFRKGHSPHQALHALREQCRKLNINWIVDADVSG